MLIATLKLSKKIRLTVKQIKTVKVMKKLVYDGEFFNVADTLKCGQIFRYESYLDGYRVYSKGYECFAKNDGDKAVIFSDNVDYFYDFFNLDYDYKKVYDYALKSGSDVVKTSAKLGKGIRILKQDLFETVISFIISQNNNIPKITKSLNFLCANYGQKLTSERGEYYSFCTVDALNGLSEDDFKKSGVGYRASYLKGVVDLVKNGFDFNSLNSLSTQDLYDSLLKIKGVGDKVANCILLFGYNRYDSFPVDVWIKKLYKDEFNGALTDRTKISQYYISEFNEYAGIIQQYLFYYKRSLQIK